MDNDKTVRLWDCATLEPIGEPKAGHEKPVMAVALARIHDRPHIVSASQDHEVRIWGVQVHGRPLSPPP